jgi:hypothetical protein
MKRLIAFLAVLMSISGASAIEKSMLSLKLPSRLEARQAQFFFQHRFYGKLDKKVFDTFFGMNEGANAGLGFRIRLFENFELVVSHVFRDNEYAMAAGYAVSPSFLPVRMQVDAEIFSNKKYYFLRESVALRRKSFAAFRIDLASKAILNRLTPVVNIGYDTELKRAGLGLGLDAAVSEKFSLIGEYYPRLKKSGPDDDLRHDSYAVGLKVQTYGHHFLFHVGNNTEIGTRRLMAGSASSDLYFGFGIQRLLEF